MFLAWLLSGSHRHPQAHIGHMLPEESECMAAADVPALTRMCTAHAHGHARRGAAPLPTGTRRTHRCSLPSTCREVNADYNKTTKITGPESTRNGSKNSVTFCSLPLLRFSSPRRPSLATELHQQPPGHPRRSPSQGHCWSLSPSLISHKKHRIFASQVQQKHKLELTPRQRARAKSSPVSTQPFPSSFCSPGKNQ